MDLKWLLVKRITLVALACLIAGAGLALYAAARDAKQQNAALAELAVRQLNLQLARIDRSTDLPERFPDWEAVSNQALMAGQCIEFRGVNPARNRGSCAGLDAATSGAPEWFVDAYRALVNDGLTVERPVIYRGLAQGMVVTAYDPLATAGRAWFSVAPLLGLSALLVAALCVVTYFVVDRALRPTHDILAGLNRLAQGDLACRLPAFRLTELNRVSEVFNAMSEELERATFERAELSRRLVDMQEQERRHIARELHDEIAQKLAALNALAACVRRGAQVEAPRLVEDVRSLETMASGLMISLRRTLTYLRPQEIDDLGLLQSLKSLVEQHNDAARGQTTFLIEATGDVERLRAETSAHVYRIVQEALTNASKHANARNVRVALTQLADRDREQIRLSVVDDGEATAVVSKPSMLGGAGLTGMRERVAALSGKFAAGPLPGGGFGLQVEFPTSQHGV
jgi:two-component system, NarL family, sensor histidine kinase UhpB